MADISILDLQNLRHLIGGFDTSHCKMQDYASQAQAWQSSSSLPIIGSGSTPWRR